MGVDSRGLGLGVAATRFSASVMLDLLDGIESKATQLSMVKYKPSSFSPGPFRLLFIPLTQWFINQADQNSGKRNLWLNLLDRLGTGFDS